MARRLVAVATNTKKIKRVRPMTFLQNENFQIRSLLASLLWDYLVALPDLLIATISTRLWDVPSKTPMLVTVASGEPTALKFSPDSSRLVFRTSTGELRVLDIDLDYLGLAQPQDIVDWSRASLSSALSSSDRQRFLLSRQGNREADQSPTGLSGLTAPQAAPGRRDPSVLRREATQTALADGVPGAARALAYELPAAGGDGASAAFQLGLDIDRHASSNEALGLAYFYLRLGERFAEGSPDGAVDEGLRDDAIARLRILPRQIPPPKLVELYRSVRDWQVP
jgi:hypothetical protein